MHRFLRFSTLPILFLGLTALPCQAIEFFCDPIDLCAWVPTDGQGNPAYNHTDPDAPWVIGGNEAVDLAPGVYEMGIGPIGVPMIWEWTCSIEEPAR